MQSFVEDDSDVPVFMQRQVLVFQEVQKTVVVPQGQHDITVVLQNQVPTGQTVQKTVEAL